MACSCKHGSLQMLLFSFAYSRLFQQGTGNDHPLNFGCSFIDLGDLSIPHHTLYIVLSDITVSALVVTSIATSAAYNFAIAASTV